MDASGCASIADTRRLECRFSSKGACDVIQMLSPQQEAVVKSIGFEGLLSMPLIKTVDRKLYAWLLGLLDTDKMVLRISEKHQIPVRAEDAVRILGIPAGSFDVRGKDDLERAMSVLRVREIFGLGSEESMAPVNMLHDVIKSTRSCETEKEIDRFICAFVSIMVGNYLAPKGRYDKVQPEIYPALHTPLKTNDFDWAGYVVRETCESSIKYKRCIMGGTTTVNLYGCVTFLQILYLDSLPISKHLVDFNLSPRIAAYTQARIAAISKCDKMDGQIGKLKHFGRTLEVADDKSQSDQSDSVTEDNQEDMSRQEFIRMVGSCFLLQGRNAAAKMLSRARYAGPLTLDDVEAYARTIQPKGQKPMKTKKIIGQKCDETSESGGSHELRNNDIPNDKPSRKQRDKKNSGNLATNIINRRTGDSEQSESSVAGISQNDGLSLELSVSSFLQPNEIRTGNFQILNSPTPGSGLSELPLLESVTEFGDVQDMNQNSFQELLNEGTFIPIFRNKLGLHDQRKGPTTLLCAKSPFDVIGTTFNSRKSNAEVLASWMEQNEEHSNYKRPWIYHCEPHHIAVTGSLLRQQIFKRIEINNDLCEMAMRSFRSCDVEMHSLLTVDVQRHYLSPDFAGYVIKGIKASEKSCYENMFCGSHLLYDVRKCWLFVAPVQFMGTWSCYAWDLAVKRMTVIDPYLTALNHEEIKEKHRDISAKMHGCFMSCLNLYCGVNASDMLSWDISLLNHGSQINASDITGLCSLFFAREFNGNNLTNLLNEGSMEIFKSELTFQLVNVPDNQPLFGSPHI